MLKEDPAYFFYMMQEEASHQRENADNQLKGNSSQKLSEETWKNSIRNTLLQHYFDLFHWHGISGELQELVRIRGDMAGSSTSPGTIASQTERSRRRLGALLGFTLKGYLNHMNSSMYGAPGFRPYFSLNEHAERQIVGPDSKDYLLFLMDRIFHERKDPEPICGLSALLREVNVIVATVPGQRQKLSARLLRCTSDVAILTEVGQQVLLSYHNHRMDLSEEIGSALSDEIKPRVWQFYSMQKTMRDLDTDICLMDSLKSTDYPSDKRRNAINTQKMRIAEENLGM